MFSLATTKLAINVISSLGVTKVVGDIIKNNTTVMTGSQKLLVNAGTLVLSSMLVEQATNHVNNTIDELVYWHKRETEQTEESPTGPTAA